MKAYVFPGQGAQFSGMGKDLYDASDEARQIFRQADEILGFEISKIMFEGSNEDLKETKVTQPAIFIHSVVKSIVADNFRPDMVAGHSLGEFSALVANKALKFEDGLLLVFKRALAMQKACEVQQSTMAAILGLDDAIAEKICSEIEEVVVPANYNCPGQLVISGSIEGINKACEAMKAAGAKRALILPVGGAFHSPLMEPAREELAKAIMSTDFSEPICPIYQNADALPHTQVNEIKENLIAQLTAPVKWTYIVQKMIADGATEFVECGPGKVLQGLIKKIDKDSVVSSI
ncbi:MAG: ACP S-malonyltransferase [Cyclobacteriaceae bacterium]